MTEKEAKTKRCCGPEGAGIWAVEQIQIPNDAVLGYGQQALVKMHYCTGPACMAWRWTVKDYPAEGGHCGLAGAS